MASSNANGTMAKEQMEQLKAYAKEAEQRWVLRSGAGVDAAMLHHHRHFMQKMQHAIEFQRGVLQRAPAPGRPRPGPGVRRRARCGRPAQIHRTQRTRKSRLRWSARNRKPPTKWPSTSTCANDSPCNHGDCKHDRHRDIDFRTGRADQRQPGLRARPPPPRALSATRRICSRTCWACSAPRSMSP